jgi:predicted phage terminase large subunit-like protein
MPAQPGQSALEALSPQTVSSLLRDLHKLPRKEKAQLLDAIEALERKRYLRSCREDFLVFCKHVYPNWKEGPHHRFLKPILHNILTGDERRLTVSMPPRFGKSETIAYLFVAWYLGHNPTHHIMMVTHTAALSADFGRKVRNLIGKPEYVEVFPDTIVSADKSASDNWTTTKEGKYLGLGIGGNVAGHGAHLLIADDLVSEQAVLANPDHAFDVAWAYMQVGPLQRLMPGGRIIMIGTRWGKRDPIGRALKWAEENTDADPWHEVRFPAVLPSGRSLWPEQWPVEQLLAKKAGMQAQYWAAQYMQEPTSEEGALLKREYWKLWLPERPPEVEFVLQVWDTAHDTKSMNDYSACTTWGVWFNEETNRQELILLDAFKGRWEFPQLKEQALSAYREWEPECVLIEKKAAGAPLIQELRQMDLAIEEYSPSRGTRTVSNDKRARINAVAPILYDGVVWAPDVRWAHEVINECAEFPNGEHDDYADCVAMALARYRRGGLIALSNDAKDDPEWARRPRRAAYY